MTDIKSLNYSCLIATAIDASLLQMLGLYKTPNARFASLKSTENITMFADGFSTPSSTTLFEKNE